jgi:phage tail sheath protein FI
MPTLVSPGVSVSITNETFFFPATAPTVPLFFVATNSGKTQIDGTTPAAGTLESGIVRTVTSLQQSLELYGVPNFRRDNSGNEQHGDARNEYGLLALNQFLGTGAVAYVVRANIDLTDATTTFISLGIPEIVAGSTVYNGVGNGTISSITASDSTVKPQTITVEFTGSTTFSVVGSLSGYIGAGDVGTAFTSTKVNLTVTAGLVPFATGDVFTFQLAYVATAGGSNVGNGKLITLVADTLAVPEIVTVTFTSPTAFSVQGTVSGISTTGAVGSPYDNNRVNFTITAGSTPFSAGDTFVITVTQVTITTPLGSNDAQKRVAIVTALQAAINSNTEVRSELYEYNLIACPGYSECVDELAGLSIDILQEAVVIADTPCNKTPDQTAQWALTSERVSNESVAYYYPWCLTSNLDGRNVLGAPSGTALRTIAYSDQQAYIWVAAAGVQRGVVTGVGKVGYVTGTLGTATTFNESNLNGGQRDTLYQYFTSINPITFFPGRGILIWGQRTSAPAASDMSHLNVSRLVSYLRRVLRKGGMPFVFEPNDQITRDNLKAAADGLLHDVLTKRGLYDFATKCDESNNTPTRIDNSELWLDIAIKPVIAAEFIYIPIKLVATGASLTG